MSTASIVAASDRVREVIDSTTLSNLEASVERFRGWLDGFGETSYDFQTVYAGYLGRKAKALYYRRPTIGTLAVSPMVLCEALLPAARRLFWIPQRFPIADAHYAMGFALLFDARGRREDYERAAHFLDVLMQTRCDGPSGHAWGYPFDWVTQTGVIKTGTPLITTTPYVYEAFAQVHDVDDEPKWLEIMRSIAEHVYHDYNDRDTSSTASTCTYTPERSDPGLILNASAYRSFLLTHASLQFREPKYLERAERNLRFVIESQNADGSWYYAMDGRRNFVDHIHTCFVLKALVKIHRLTGDRQCATAIDRGLSYYTEHLFDGQGLPRPFSIAPRFVIYRRELYDYAECLNLAVLLKGTRWSLDRLLATVVADLLNRWQRVDGAFRSRQLRLGWDDVPMHRWAQAQLFRSLSLLLQTSWKAH
jgi:hypothetical protein